VTDPSAAAGHRPLSEAACDLFMSNPATARRVTRLGTGLTMANMVERAARCPGRAHG
jgi:hypothetical protein